MTDAHHNSLTFINVRIICLVAPVRNLIHFARRVTQLRDEHPWRPDMVSRCGRHACIFYQQLDFCCKVSDLSLTLLDDLSSCLGTIALFLSRDYDRSVPIFYVIAYFASSSYSRAAPPFPFAVPGVPGVELAPDR